MEKNENYKMCPDSHSGQDSTQKSNLSFLEWTKRVITEHPDILEYMLKSSDQLDRIIAKRIIQNASGGC